MATQTRTRVTTRSLSRSRDPIGQEETNQKKDSHKSRDVRKVRNKSQSIPRQDQETIGQATEDTVRTSHKSHDQDKEEQIQTEEPDQGFREPEDLSQRGRQQSQEPSGRYMTPKEALGLSEPNLIDFRQSGNQSRQTTKEVPSPVKKIVSKPPQEEFIEEDDFDHHPFRTFGAHTGYNDNQ